METGSRRYSKTPEAVSRLTPEQFRVTQQGDTELPNTGRYLHNKEPGIMWLAEFHQAHRASQHPGIAR